MSDGLIQFLLALDGALAVVAFFWAWVVRLGWRETRAQIEAHDLVFREQGKKLIWIEGTVADRILKLDKEPDDEPQQLPRGEVREVVRSYQNPQKSEGWREFVDSAKHGWRLDVAAKGRARVIKEVDAFLLKMDRISRAARLHLDAPTDETQRELDAALVDAGVESSKILERL